MFVQTGGLRETFAAHGALRGKRETQITLKTQDAVATDIVKVLQINPQICRFLCPSLAYV